MQLLDAPGNDPVFIYWQLFLSRDLCFSLEMFSFVSFLLEKLWYRRKIIELWLEQVKALPSAGQKVYLSGPVSPSL